MFFISIRYHHFYKTNLKTTFKRLADYISIEWFFSSILDTIVVKMGYLKYPVTLLKSVNISFGFDYLLHPIVCVL